MLMEGFDRNVFIDAIRSQLKILMLSKDWHQYKLVRRVTNALEQVNF